VDPFEKFKSEVRSNIESAGKDPDLHALSRVWSHYSSVYGYTYNFSWLGVPVIQLPQDIVAVQELIWTVKPDLIIETGVAWGGSLMMTASMLAVLDYCEAVQSGVPLDPTQSKRRVVGIDIDIRPHNRAAIEAHPMGRGIELIEGSSVDADVIARVRTLASAASRVMVCLDSNHTHEHVLAELEAYAPLVTPGSYCIVFDTLIEDRKAGSFPGKPWDKGDNPKTAVWEFVGRHPEFSIDKEIDNKLLISVAPDGYLKRN
jgi:cephalosporin hydroxylase